MALLDRLLNLEEPKIATHQFMAAVSEYKRGAVTKQNIVDAFDLDINEATSLQNFLANIDSSVIDSSLIHDVLLLGEVGYYTKTQVKNRLGV